MKFRKWIAVLLLVVMLSCMAAAPALAAYKIYMTDESTRAIKRYSTLKRGSKGNAVRDMQNRLASLGYLDYSDVDGVYGAGTQDAVYRFQKGNLLTGADGVAYPYTLYKLYDETAIPAEGLYVDTLGPGSTGLDVLRLEKRLCDTGYLAERYVDRYYDDATEAAVFEFQYNNPTECLDGIACGETQSWLFSYSMNSN